jgi:dipeptidyl aminopeptidase/acylaminoacyl peptidase
MRRIKTHIAEASRFAGAFAVAASLLLQPISINAASAAEAVTKKPQKSAETAATPAKKAAATTNTTKKKAPKPERAMLRPGDGFMHDGKFVRVEAFHAQGEGQQPAVIILHGASGLGDGTLFYPQALALAERGISAFIVHYFDGLPSRKNAAAANLHDKREQIVTEALNYLESQPYVDRDRIGVFGLSLGGFQALSIASKDERIQAVVDVIGAMPAQVARDGVSRMPPTMILHGDRDRTVPFRRAQELAEMLDSLGTPYEMKIYHGETHNFRIAAREDSIREAADFFVKHLKTRL